MKRNQHLSKAEQARALFESGCNCAQSVAGSFYREMGLSEETVLLLASPFGGGISRMRETCGAVTGMMMVLGLTHGYRPFTDEETHLREKTRVYRTGQELAESFRRKYGTLLCRELLRGTGADDTLSRPRGQSNITAAVPVQKSLPLQHRCWMNICKNRTGKNSTCLSLAVRILFYSLVYDGAAVLSLAAFFLTGKENRR